MKFNRVVDLSHILRPSEETRKFEIEMVGSEEIANVTRLPGQWYIMHDIEMVSHIGTHIEVPYHCSEDGTDLADVPLESLIGEAVILDLTKEAKSGEAITLQQMQEAAQTAGGVKSGDIVFVHLGWDKYYGTDAYGNGPMFSLPAMQWLVEQGMKLMGVDCSGVIIPNVNHRDGHMVLFDHEICLIENLTNLNKLTQSRVEVFALPIGVKKLESFPLRVIALE
ncbi:MAG: cyclase family protein [Candidatus Poribacteria bacterium]